MVIKYPNFNKFPSFLTTTDTDNNLLIDLVDRAKTADSVNWSDVNIDADKDMNLKSLTNLNTISVSNEKITNSTISNLAATNATITNGDIEKIGTNLMNDIIKLSLIFK